MNILLLIIILILLFGGGGFYIGGPAIGGSGLGLVGDLPYRLSRRWMPSKGLTDIREKLRNNCRGWRTATSPI